MALLLAACRERAPLSPALPAAPSSPPAAAVRPLSLVPGTEAAAELAGGAVHAYGFELRAGTFADLSVEQRGIDVVVTVTPPGGPPLPPVDSPNRGEGPEPAPVLAETGGRFRLEVRSSGPSDAPGRYAVRVGGVRPATPRDRARVKAERTFAEGEALRRRGDGASLRAAIERDRRAAGLFRQAGDRGREADVLYALGRVHWLLGEPEGAVRELERALPVFRELGEASKVGRTLNALGPPYRSLGRTDDALAGYRESLALHRRLADLPGEAAALNSLGRLLAERGEAEEALARYTEARAVWDELGQPRDAANARANEGRLYLALGEPGRAAQSLARAFEALERAGASADAAAVLIDLGVAEARTGRTREGLSLLSRALELHRRLGDRRHEAVTLSNLGWLRTTLGDEEGGRRFYLQALPLFVSLGDRGNQAATLASLGSLELKRGDFKAAEAEYRRALLLFRALGHRSGEAEALLGIAHALRGRGELAAAHKTAEAALSRVESLRAEPGSPALRAAFLASRQDAYTFTIDLLLEMGHAGAALEISERARARSLLDALAEAGAAQGASPALAARETAAGRRVEEAEARRAALAESGAPPARTAAAEAELRDRLDELERVQAEVRRTVRPEGAPARPATVAEIRRLLDPGALLLEIALGESRSVLWAVTHEGVESFELPRRAEIEEAARLAHGLLAESHRAAARASSAAALAELSRLVLEPVADRLGDRRLLIVPDGALHSIPFAALPLPGASGEPLVARHEVVTLPSASILAALRRRPARTPPAAGTLAVLADPVFDASDPRVAGGKAAAARATARGRSPARGFARLPFSGAEAEAILALVPPERRLAALGFAARREAVTGGGLNGYRVVHFATHGVLDTERPELSGVALSMVDEAGNPRDGFLRAHEIYRLGLSADLVVLSACETALGREVRGEGLVGLPQGFLHAGARGVLVSLWPVADRATAELMRRFYTRLLADGLPPSAALREAQESLRREPGWEAPYYWAGFVFEGDWKAAAVH